MEKLGERGRISRTSLLVVISSALLLSLISSTIYSFTPTNISIVPVPVNIVANGTGIVTVKITGAISLADQQAQFFHVRLVDGDDVRDDILGTAKVTEDTDGKGPFIRGEVRTFTLNFEVRCDDTTLVGQESSGESEADLAVEIDTGRVERKANHFDTAAGTYVPVRCVEKPLYEAQPDGQHSGIVTHSDDDPRTEDTLWDNEFEDEVVKAINAHFHSAKFTFLQCYSGGFIDDLKRSLPSNKHWSTSSASKHDKLSYGYNGPDGYSAYGKPHTEALQGGKTDEEAFQLARDKDLAEETPQYHSAQHGDRIRIGQDAASYHALLFVGEPDRCDHWNELVRVYQMLRGKEYPADNIKILFGDGTRRLEDGTDVVTQCRPPAGVKPGDPGEAGLASATRDELIDEIRDLGKAFTSTSPNEQLFLWVYDHGDFKEDGQDKVKNCGASGPCQFAIDIDETFLYALELGMTDPYVVFDPSDIVTSRNEVFLNDQSLGLIDPTLGRQIFPFSEELVFLGTNEVTIMADNEQSFTIESIGIAAGVCEGRALDFFGVVKDVSPEWATVGEDLVYTLTYANGDLPVTEAIIREFYDPHFLFESAEPAPDEGTDSVWTIGELTPGESGQIVISGQVKLLPPEMRRTELPVTVDWIENVAVADSDQTDPFTDTVQTPIIADLSDAPDYPIVYHLMFANEWLGAGVDGESVPRVPEDNFDDGVILKPWYRPFRVVRVPITISTSGLGAERYGWEPERRLYLRGWIDYNMDGDWGDPGELVVDCDVAPGTTGQCNKWPANWNAVQPSQTFIVKFNVGLVTQGWTWARFRLSYGAPVGPTGPALFGEVEDYEVGIFLRDP